MDLYRFINSRDIREHHKEIGYQYSALEAAWLVSQCQNLTLKEKHEAWQWIIDNMPDMKVDNCGKWSAFYGEPIHSLLAEYMAMENQFIAEFKDNTGGWLYSYKSYYTSLRYGYGGDFFEGVFSSWDKCIQYILQNEDAEDISFVDIVRGFPDEGKMRRNHGGIKCEITAGTIVSVEPDYSSEENERWFYLTSFFDELWFDFPVPFNCGDIVYLKNPYHPLEHEPIVWTDTPSEREEYAKKRLEHGGDTSDMNFTGYAVSDGIYSEVWWNYMDAELYREELTGMNRLLIPVSNWLKGKFGKWIDLPLAGYHQILTEEMLAKAAPCGILEEYLKLAGLPVEEKKDQSGC